MEITESSLASALEGFILQGRPLSVSGIADHALTVVVDDADLLAAALFATLSRMAALREPHPAGPRTQDADLCASCGNQFKPGQVCDSCREAQSDPWAGDRDVVDAHICCEHVLGSLGAGELDAMDKIACLLRHRSERSKRRVLTWARDFLLDRDEPPF